MKELVLDSFAIVFKISRIILFSSIDGWKGREGVGRTIGGSGLRGPKTPRQEDSTFRIIIQIIINHIFNIGFS